MVDTGIESNKSDSFGMSIREAFRREIQKRFEESYYANGSVFCDVKPFADINDPPKRKG